jgi:opacity protein-like surface antigen
MKRFVTLAVIVTMTVVLCASAYARDRSKNRTKAQSTGFYIGGNAGLNLLGDSSLENGSSLGIEYDSGYLVGGSLGYDFGEFRLDAEVAYKTNDASDIITTPSGGFTADGSTSVLSYMINGYFDIPINRSLKPYLGAGIGYATVTLDVGIPGVFPTLADDSDSVLAYQFSAGVGYEISRTTTLNLGYRYFATEDPEMINFGGLPFTTEYQTHEFVVGVRFLF